VIVKKPQLLKLDFSSSGSKGVADESVLPHDVDRYVVVYISYTKFHQ
jgi:hypothetical protein